MLRSDKLCFFTRINLKLTLLFCISFPFGRRWLMLDRPGQRRFASQPELPAVLEVTLLMYLFELILEKQGWKGRPPAIFCFPVCLAFTPALSVAHVVRGDLQRDAVASFAFDGLIPYMQVRSLWISRQKQDASAFVYLLWYLSWSCKTSEASHDLHVKPYAWP